MTIPFTADEIIQATSIKLAEERAYRVALEAKVFELNAKIESVALTPGPQGEPGVGIPGERGEPGTSVTLDDVRPIISSEVDRLFSAIKLPENGKDGVGIPGERGEKGEPGIPGESVDKSEIEALVVRAVADQIAKTEKPDEAAPGEVAENVALAIRMIAEAPRLQAPHERQMINVYSNVTLPEAKAHQVNVSVPEQATPVVNVAAPSVTVELPKPRKEITTVTSWDKSGRITSFEKQEV
jgi:hypothetical protein